MDSIAVAVGDGVTVGFAVGVGIIVLRASVRWEGMVTTICACAIPGRKG